MPPVLYAEANAVSSRSHAVLEIQVRRTNRAAGYKSQVLCGKLALVDLAGSYIHSHHRISEPSLILFYRSNTNEKHVFYRSNTNEKHVFYRSSTNEKHVFARVFGFS